MAATRTRRHRSDNLNLILRCGTAEGSTEFLRKSQIDRRLLERSGELLRITADDGSRFAGKKGEAVANSGREAACGRVSLSDDNVCLSR